MKSYRTDEKQVFCVIGAIMVEWSKLEKQVTLNIHGIDNALHETNASDKPLELTDLSQFRNFKERKGYLRKYVETHGTREQLSELDQVYQNFKGQKHIRDSLGHEMIEIVPAFKTEPIKILSYKHGNIAGGKPHHTQEFTLTELEDVPQRLRVLREKLFRIFGRILSDMLEKSNSQ